MVAVRDVVKVRRISPTGATRRTGRAGLPGAQQLVVVKPVRTHGAIRGGRGAVAVAGASNEATRVVLIDRTDGRRARTGSGGAVGAFRASIGGAGDGALIVVNVIPLRDREGDEGVRDRNSVHTEIEKTEKETETKAQTKTEVGWNK